jgi:uncharacterized protein (TIGR02588 family)
MKKTFPSRSRYRISAESITFVVASLVVMILVGLVVYAWLTRVDQPPTIAVTSTTEIRQAQGQYYVPFTVKNVGGGTAGAVQIIGELRINGRVEEAGEQEIDFLSKGEQEEGAFVFSRNPREGEVIVRVASYKLP